MNKQSLKRWVEMGLFALTAVLTFLALLFNVYDIEMSVFGSKIESHGNGFNVISEYPQVLEGMGDWLGFYSIIIIVAIIAEGIVYGVMFAKKSEKFLLMEKIFVIVNVILTLVYMINGLSAKSSIEEQSTLYIAQTAAFIPFILVAIFAAAYFIVVFKVKEIRFGAQKATKGSEVSAADELVKYKKLLDDGVITQEEYDIKKKELLGL